MKTHKLSGYALLAILGLVLSTLLLFTSGVISIPFAQAEGDVPPAESPPPSDPAPSDPPPSETLSQDAPQDPAPADTGETGESGEPGGEGGAGGDGSPTESGENGESGDDGANGGEVGGENDGADGADGTEGSEGLPEGDTLVSSGDATSVTDANNEANTNTITTPTGGSGSTVELTGAADLNAQSTTTSETGENTAASQGNAAALSGTSIAIGNVVNLASTNIVNSNGYLLFLNHIFGSGFDLRSLDLSYFFGNPGGAGGCTLLSCNGEANLTVNMESDTTINNTMVVRSDSGGNVAISEDGDALAASGNSFAAGNAVNIANSNFIESNYLLLTFNNFGALDGDITFNGADFFQALLAQSLGLSGGANINVNNTTTINNDQNTVADTGANAAVSDGGAALVGTGDALAGGSNINIENTTQVGGTQFFVIVRVFGNWGGQVTGLPDGFSVGTTDGGFFITSDSGSFAGLSGGDCCSGNNQLNVNSTSTAAINNNMGVYALSGDNFAMSENGNAAVLSGMAAAANNSINMASTNVIGANWIFAIFNIFGDWSGNFSFGHPDLWVGAVARAGNPAPPGSAITYDVTVINRGDSDASNVILSAKFPKDMLKFQESGLTHSNGSRRFALGDVRRGETRQFSFVANAGDTSGVVEVPLELSVSSVESDENTIDNTEILSVFIGHMESVRVGVGQGFTKDPKITMKKTTDVQTAAIGSKVKYDLVITNEGGPAYGTELVDVMKNSAGKTMFKQGWKFDTIKEGETITVSYTVLFDEKFKPGKYTNTATLTGRKNDADSRYSVGMPEVKTKHTITLTPPAIGEVKGEFIAAPLMCAEYITSPIIWGEENDSKQVTRLEFFVRDFLGYKNIKPDGKYDAMTMAAIMQFQATNSSQILSPWGLDAPTGNVYHTTMKALNEMYCQGASQFPLSNAQLKEIASVKGGTYVQMPSKPSAPQEVKKADKEEKVTSAPKDVEGASKTINRAPQPRRNEYSLLEFSKMLFAIPEAEAFELNLE